MSDDFSKIEQMKYSGRMLHQIVTNEGFYGVGYTITGRSPPSQARRMKLGSRTGTIMVESVTDNESLKRMFNIELKKDLDKLTKEIAKGSPALIYYPAIRPVKDELGELTGIVGSNGIQTNLIYSAFFNRNVTSGDFANRILELAFQNPHRMYDPKYDRDIDITSYEPDDPNFTSRINLCLNLVSGDKFGFVSVSKDDDSSDKQMRFRTPFIENGTVLSLPTYMGGNEKPRIRPFEGDLIESKIYSSDASDICESLYHSIGRPNPEDGNKVYRVAAAVMIAKPMGPEIRIINRADRE